MGIYVLVGAGLLGALSCMLIVWSLWTRSQARKRARARMQAQYAPPSAGYPVVQAPVTSGHTVVAMPPTPLEEEPRTQFMSTEELFGGAAVPDEPTQFLSDEDLYGAAPADEPSTAMLSDQEVFGDDEEVATTFMTTDELFGGRPARTEATSVLPEPTPSVAPPRPSTPRHLPSPKPAAPPRYTGFVGDRAEDRDDEDGEFDESDPETELVHQAELLRLISHNKRSE